MTCTAAEIGGERFAGRNHAENPCALCGGQQNDRPALAAGHEEGAGRHGKQTLRQLMKHNTGVSNIEITDQNIRAFSSTAKKYGLDFALKKDTSGEHTRYLVFFKGRDADVITAAFREFSAKNLSREKNPSIRRKLEKAQEQSKTQHKEQERGEKVKTRERSVER